MMDELVCVCDARGLLVCVRVCNCHNCQLEILLLASACLRRGRLRAAAEPLLSRRSRLAGRQDLGKHRELLMETAMDPALHESAQCTRCTQ